jgi:hypothetical protein
LVTVTDIFPTLLDMANLTLPEDNPPLDGRSITSYLEGDTKTLGEKQAVITHWHPLWDGDHYDPVQDKRALDVATQKMALVTEHYKLIQNEYAVPGSPKHRKGIVLIDLKADPMESSNVAESKPEVVRAMQQELKHWFDEVIQSPHTFTPTVFQIGWEGKTSSEVLAFGTSKTVGVKNGSHSVTQWDTVGDYAEYLIHVHRAGTYNVSLSRFAKKNETGTVIVVSCNGNEVRSELENTSTQLLGPMHLDAGEHTLKLEIAAIESDQPPSLQIKALQFDRQ